MHSITWIFISHINSITIHFKSKFNSLVLWLSQIDGYGCYLFGKFYCLHNFAMHTDCILFVTVFIEYYIQSTTQNPKGNCVSKQPEANSLFLYFHENSPKLSPCGRNPESYVKTRLFSTHYVFYLNNHQLFIRQLKEIMSNTFARHNVFHNTYHEHRNVLRFGQSAGELIHQRNKDWTDSWRFNILFL